MPCYSIILDPKLHHSRSHQLGKVRFYVIACSLVSRIKRGPEEY
jgi:hypothetical protein